MVGISRSNQLGITSLLWIREFLRVINNSMPPNWVALENDGRKKQNMKTIRA